MTKVCSKKYIEIFVKTLTGKSIALDIAKDSTILYIKSSIPAACSKILFAPDTDQCLMQLLLCVEGAELVKPSCIVLEARRDVFKPVVIPLLIHSYQKLLQRLSGTIPVLNDIK